MARVAFDLIGKSYGKLKVLKRATNIGDRVAWKCLCSCGSKTVVRANQLTSGQTKSCGCLRVEEGRTGGHKRQKHGFTRPETQVLYKTHYDMINRCYNTEHPSYASYGGRGIRVCGRWRKSGCVGLKNFIEDMKLRPKNKELDRKDNNGNYTPTNCRWVTRKTNSSNRRSARLIFFQGKKWSLTKWSQVIGISISTLHRRLTYYNWPVARALTTPVRGSNDPI